jgi:hypothetical protein
VSLLFPSVDDELVLGVSPRPPWHTTDDPLPFGAEVIYCHQATRVILGITDDLYCEQALLARDEPDSARLRCRQAKLASRDLHGPPAWWDDVLCTWGSTQYDWAGNAIEAPVAP